MKLEKRPLELHIHLLQQSLHTCWSKFSLVARSVLEKSFTTQGTIFFWYWSPLSRPPNLKRGAKTEDPAPPNSKALINWGRILCLQKLSGNESKLLFSSLKKSFLCEGSIIWITPRCSFHSIITVWEEWSKRLVLNAMFFRSLFTWSSSILRAMVTKLLARNPPCSRRLLSRFDGFGRDFGLALTISQ